MFFCELNRSKCKTYLIASEQSRRAIIVDPLRERIDRYIAFLAYRGWQLDLIIDTHTHADHRSGALDLNQLLGVPVAMHRRAPAPYVTRHLQENDHIMLGEVGLRVIFTPGHTPDGISLSIADRVLTGDVLLIHSTGRTDFAGGDAGEEYDAIMQKLFTLPDETLVFPAHDYRGHTQSTIGEEKRSNPKIAGRSREDYVTLMNNLGLPLPDNIQEALQPNQAGIDTAEIKFPDLDQLNRVMQLTPQEVFRRLHGPTPPVVIDVREEQEFHGELGHIPGSRLIPLRELSERVRELEPFKSGDMVVVCRAGARSTTAAAILSAMGFEHVSNLKGGMLDWSDARMPVER
jgi:sulfur dioxygenase